jgi:hypothetical protein
MVTAPPRLSTVIAADPPVPASVASGSSGIEPQPPPADGFVVEWQLATGAGREW